MINYYFVLAFCLHLLASTHAQVDNNVLSQDVSQEASSNVTPEDPATVTQEVFFNISIGGVPVGRIVIGLFADTAPLTVANFVAFAVGTTNGYGYTGSILHRVINGFVIQGGDITNRDGTGALSIYGGNFADENFILNHYGPGWIAMANAGPDTNASQFAIMMAVTPWLDGHHVVFGKIVQGMDVAILIENIQTNRNDRPLLDCIITNSGILPVDVPYIVAKE